jgi:hypothetical protein
MNKIGWFGTSFFGWLVGIIMVFGGNNTESPLPNLVVPPNFQPKQQLEKTEPKIDPDLVGVQVPIPKECRVFNKTGSQCVWCSIEVLARYHKVADLYEGDRRITKHHTWGTFSWEVNHVLTTQYPKTKWTQITNRSQLRGFLQKYVTEKKFGVGFSVPGHMLNLIHYDENARIVKVIDNDGPTPLEVQQWSLDKFNGIAEGWALTIFPPDYKTTVSDSFNYEPDFIEVLCRGMHILRGFDLFNKS